MFVGLLQKMLDPGGISNWSVTYVDSSERRWHPKTYRARDISLKFLKNITVIIMSQHHSFQYMTSCYVSSLFCLIYTFLPRLLAVWWRECTRDKRWQGTFLAYCTPKYWNCHVFFSSFIFCFFLFFFLAWRRASLAMYMERYKKTMLLIRKEVPLRFC